MLPSLIGKSNQIGIAGRKKHQAGDSRKFRMSRLDLVQILQHEEQILVLFTALTRSGILPPWRGTLHRTQ
ncbi:hypothetical protein MUK42_33675 [Musa troglodytarum]|uniref:Uncharacterized protein n=1 Tax=Musa troglodytarum TaxID=320322 RepID=A0A9E7FJS3_9LILI|nr:hypothetical protein MUK42_33675 [Musa troglodytarum]